MKLSQKELEMLSSTNLDQLIDDIWWYIRTPPNVLTKEEKEAHIQRLNIFTMATDVTVGRQRREIDRLTHQVNMTSMKRNADGSITAEANLQLEITKTDLKAAFRGEFHNPMTHIPAHLADIDELFVIQLVPAFTPHPEFSVTYYAGYSKPPKWQPEETHDIHAAARWSVRDEAQKVAEVLLPTISCVWKVVEA
jgi:hypothetical protein